MVTLATDRAAFAAERRPILQRAEHRLLGSVRNALRHFGEEGWYDALVRKTVTLMRVTYYAEAGRRHPRELHHAALEFEEEMRSSLQHTHKPEDKRALEVAARAIAASLSTAAVNFGTLTAARLDEQHEQFFKVWLTMRDERVRHAHADMDGEAVHLSETFSVDGHRMYGPGDMSAPLELWINCRCILAIEQRSDTMSLLAAGGGNANGMGIFALPTDTDPIQTVSSEDLPHVTMIWMGEVGDYEGDIHALRDRIEVILPKTGLVTEEIVGREELGDDKADVLMIRGEALGAIREKLLKDELVREAYDRATQFPQWTPHLTIGYPDTPALKGDDDIPADIMFDRVALWAGEERYEFPLKEDTMSTDEITQVEEPEVVAADESVPWHGVLAPEDTLSGDGRKFTANALRWRDLPLPLSWQKTSAAGHDGSVVVARIDEIWRDGNLIRAKGAMLNTPEADEVIGIMAEGGLRGVSVDVDDATMMLQDADGKAIDMSAPLAGDPGDPHDEVMAFTDGRICGATLCAIPAFAEAMVFLGEEGDPVVASAEFRTISEKPWDGSSSRFTDDEWFRSTIIHTNGDSRVKSDNKLPILEPSGALSRAGVHAAAARLNQVQAAPALISKAKGSLRTAYKELGEEAPDGIKASDEEVQEFKDLAPGVTEDGPGWLTHPVDTDRLRDYWVRGEGAVKIGWGLPGDFNRCRTHLAQYVKPQYLSGYCANRHKDALGFWPGEHNSIKGLTASAPSVRLVEASPQYRPPAEWFDDPHLIGPSPLVVTEEGRVFGHLCTWDECHIGYDKVCVTPPPSMTDYAYFKTGAVLTDGGEVPVGQITLGTGHAPQRATAFAALAHYDNTGTAAADVNLGDDEWGVWVAGAIRPGTSEKDVYALRAASLSGDWREIGGNLELVAALAVNVPGFPIPRVQIAASAGHQTALVAAGIVRQPVSRVGRDEVREIVAAALDEVYRRQASRAKMQRLAQKMGRDPKSRMKALAASVRRN